MQEYLIPLKEGTVEEALLQGWSLQEEGDEQQQEEQQQKDE